jgi:DNA-nicking Smr family endonuclease
VAGRRLAPEEAALWAKVIESVTPIVRRKAISEPVTQKPAPPSEAEPPRKPPVAAAARAPAAPRANAKKPAPPPKPPANTLDGSWDRKLGRGIVSPDISIDLHGHTLAGAYGTLDEGLAHAIAAGMRVVLLVTGKPRPERGGRGAIRAAVGDWLAGSRHASRIAAVRGAHPRHGGQGALYIILRRDRE